MRKTGQEWGGWACEKAQCAELPGGAGPGITKHPRKRPPDRRDGAGCMWRKRAIGDRGSSPPPAANKLCALGTSLVSPGLKWIIYKGEMLTPYLEEMLPFSTNYISLLHTKVKDKCFEVPQL